MVVDPIATHAAGESRRSPSGRDLSGQYAETYWVYKLDDRNDADLGEAIKAANDWMRHQSEFMADFTQAGGAVEYCVKLLGLSPTPSEHPSPTSSETHSPTPTPNPSETHSPTPTPNPSETHTPTASPTSSQL